MGRSQEEFDYIVVGAGPSSAGLLYGILEKYSSTRSTDLPFSVAVLERGGGRHDKKTLVPNRWHEASHTPSSSVSLLQTSIGNRVIDVPTGRGLGGSTNVNACIVAPPSADDFQAWPAPWNENMMPSIHKIQDALVHHGAVYQFNTSVKSMLSIDTANRSEGFWRESIFPSFVTSIPLAVERNDKGEYKRINYHDGLVEPILRENPQLARKITWLRGTEAQQLLFDGHRVAGVECESASGDVYQIKARMEVILAAGAIETPALLIASGVGPEDDLKKARIPSRGYNLPVGYNLRDHVLLPRICFHSFTSYDLSPTTVQALYNAQDGENRFQMMLFGSASYPGLISHIMASIFRRRVDFSPRWLSDIINYVLYVVFRLTRFGCRVAVHYTPIFFLLRHFCFGINIALLNPKSTGRIRVARRSRASKGECRRKDLSIGVDCPYLTDTRDIDAFVTAWAQSRQLCSSWLDQGVEVFPGPLFPINQRDLFGKFIHEACQPYFHFCGTCAIGSVTDNALRVKGIDGLRVCDASVFATIPSAPTALTCAGLGYALSAILFDNEHDKKEK